MDLATLHRGADGKVEPYLAKFSPGEEPSLPHESFASRLSRVAPLVLAGSALTAMGVALFLVRL